jgi:hypothetical protein
MQLDICLSARRDGALPHHSTQHGNEVEPGTQRLRRTAPRVRLDLDISVGTVMYRSVSRVTSPKILSCKRECSGRGSHSRIESFEK